MMPLHVSILMTDGIGLFLEKYGGWTGLGLYFLYKDLWPFLRDKVYPAQREQAQQDRDRYRRLEEMQLSINERQVKAFEDLSKSVKEMTVAITTNNERISQLVANHTNHASFVQEAITDMRVKIENPPRGRRKPSPKSDT